MTSPKLCESLVRTQSAKRNFLKTSRDSIESEDLDNDHSQVLDKVKHDRVSNTKPEEDRRRRTIIVEKKDGTYGFTLQSYGIHYKKEQEIEMITYVDYVDYDGPAYRAGMREGDVILSINGHDMEKADHKMLVNFIKNCDTRMRMVVLFEDCVRKVELHIRYIQLQRILQNKMTELDKLCLKEKELLMGKWKTYSLPARKKTTGNSDVTKEDVTPRPTVSTEDVAKPQGQPVLLSYQYLDPRYQYVVRSGANSNEYVISWNQNDQNRQIILKTCDPSRQQKGYHQSNGVASATNVQTRREHAKTSHTRHLCNPCIQANNNQDNNSLEAYDLASPCCEPHCVPTSKRRSRHKKSHTVDETKDERDECKENLVAAKTHGGHRSSKYFSFGTNLVSQCSLHSCASSELSHTGCNDAESSAVSYTTSLSTDTLYWDNTEPTASRQHSTKSQSSQSSRQHRHSVAYQAAQQAAARVADQSYASNNSMKPKSWDNLTTKAFGGYGFGYEYLDTVSTSNKSLATSTMPSSTKNQHAKVNQRSTQSYQMKHYQPKSSDNLLSSRYDTNLSDSNLSCECLNNVDNTRTFSTTNFNQQQQQQPSCSSNVEIYYHRDRSGVPQLLKHRQFSEGQPGEITKL